MLFSTGSEVTPRSNVTMQGFSGRKIGKLVVALQGALYVSSDGALSSVAAWKLAETKVKEHLDKIKMMEGKPLENLWMEVKS